MLRMVTLCALSLACSSSPMASGTGGSGGGGGSAGSGGSGGSLPPPNPATGCNGTPLLANPDDPSAHGPWAVGARTVTLAGLTTEVWYPAQAGSPAGTQTARYDLREHLPDADQSKIPDADNPWQLCDCYRDLPIDDTHGPYPVVLFIHGTAGFRTQSLTFMTHWASRGFVVLAADHPGINLKDILAGGFGQSDQAGDARKLLDALVAPAGDVAFLAGRLDLTNLALAGHSAGGGAIAGFGNQARVLIPMAARGTMAGSALKSTLAMGGMSDGINNYSNVQSGYSQSPAKKRLVGLSNAGHLAFSDLCYIGRDQGGLLKIAEDHGIMVNFLISTLAQDGCKPGQLMAERGWQIIDYATSAVLEETLQCNASSAAKLTAIRSVYAEVGEYQEQLQ